MERSQEIVGDPSALLGMTHSLSFRAESRNLLQDDKHHFFLLKFGGIENYPYFCSYEWKNE